jgi:hypothetical protein
MPEIETLAPVADLLARAAFHEAGHAVAALCYRLPLLEVIIRDDGSGNTTYTRRFGLAEAERWTVVTYAGPQAEFDLFGDRRGDRSDLRAIDTMLDWLQLAWDEDKLTELRRQARRLVERERLATFTAPAVALGVLWCRRASPVILTTIALCTCQVERTSASRKHCGWCWDTSKWHGSFTTGMRSTNATSPPARSAPRRMQCRKRVT